MGSHWPVTPLHTKPWGQPPHAGSTVHKPVFGLHTLGKVQPSPQFGSTIHVPQVPRLVSVSQVSPVAQVPPQVVSHTHWPHVADAGVRSQIVPCWQAPWHVVSQTHWPVPLLHISKLLQPHAVQ